MIQSSEIREHMEVVGSDGGHVGRVDKVMGDEIELAKLDLASGLKHHMIPMSWVDHDRGRQALPQHDQGRRQGGLAREALARASGSRIRRFRAVRADAFRRHFTAAQKRWMRLQASSSTALEVA